MTRVLCALIAAGLLAACSSLDRTVPASGSVIPNTKLQLTPGYATTVEKLVYFGGAAYLLYVVLDPMSPNWSIDEAKLSEDTYFLGMKMKRVHTGGDGEARMVFNRRAEQLARAGGYAGYEILSYSEGIQSDLVAQRVGEGVIQLRHGTR
ncbi:MAG: hypothetical protein KKD25_05195 [Gammaproteobacteria bacterium]|jgi:hypothetical protein|nr:hypothetical protein [Gammaproteobacteria bacterium]MBU0772107.1 hypothetical protein [Gammaproteobacteria bacterium]MBU1848756.1 hypothetical protein [Gammaproteobacteria bacterium]